MTGERPADEKRETHDAPAAGERSDAPAEEKPFQAETSATDAATDQATETEAPGSDEPVNDESAKGKPVDDDSAKEEQTTGGVATVSPAPASKTAKLDVAQDATPQSETTKSADVEATAPRAKTGSPEAGENSGDRGGQGDKSEDSSDTSAKEDKTNNTSDKVDKASDASGGAAKADDASAKTNKCSDASGEAGEQRLIAGRYRIRRRIGGGAMGVVYLGHDEVLDRTVALKELMLSPAFSKDEAEQARKRSFREARLAARLQHRHAITVFNVVEDAGKPVLVMEYLASESLSELLARRGSLPPEEVARIGMEAASALAAAHEAGIVHRDVKPGNILIGENGIAKITDFGISRAADDGTITGSGSFAGTPAFLSPEAARGEQPSQASDVFSLGATLYTAVEGRFPYGDIENQMALLYAAAAGRYTPPTKAGPLTDILTRMMAIKPSDRPTMAEVARELAAVHAPQQPSRRSRRLLFAGLAVLVVIIAGVLALVLIPGGKNQNVASGNPPSVAQTVPPPPHRPSVSASAPVTSTYTTVTTTTITAPPPAVGGQSTDTELGDTTGVSLVEAVRQYYQLVPGNLDEAWTRLSPSFQQRIGRSEYVRYWSQFSNVTVVGQPQQVGPDKVEVTIQYDWKGGRWQETHHLGMVVIDGRPLIDSDPAVPNTRIG